MNGKLSWLMKDVEALSEIESELNRFYNEQKRPQGLRVHTPYKWVFPKIKRLTHRGPLKILAFSDYRTQSIEELFSLLEQIAEKPDLIIYCGDDVGRFAPIPEESILFSFADEDSSEVTRIWISDGIHKFSSPHYGFVLRLPRNVATEEGAQKRIFEIMEFLKPLYEQWRNYGISEEFLKELLVKHRTFHAKERSSGLRRIVDVVDNSKGTTILSSWETTSKTFIPLGCYLDLFRLIKDCEPSSVAIDKIRDDERFAYYYISLDGKPKRNIFEELATYAKYGLVAIIGNDEPRAERVRIHGKKVYELNSTWLRIGKLFIVGLEGSTCGLGPSGNYSEGDVRLRLELACGFSEGCKLIIASHTPPRGILDRAMRFGEEAIGSLALRDFLEENNNVALVICGHVHRCGGERETINNTTIVNVSSHDDPFSRANVAWITLDRNANVVETKWFALPSLIETILTKNGGMNKFPHLCKKTGLSKDEAIYFIDAYNRYGGRFFEDLTALARLKFHFGFSWENVFRLYSYGVKVAEQITTVIYEKILKESFGIHKVHLKRAYAKVLRERNQENLYLLSPIPLPEDDQIIVFDTEYSSAGVLYGFFDPELNEFMQFWFDEKIEAKKFLRNKSNKVFVYWGGSDRSLLRQELGCCAPTLNLLYYVQTTLVAPIQSASLREVHDVLFGTLESNEFWRRSFYSINGLDKLILCNRILLNHNDIEARENLAAANKADVLALWHVIEKLKQLNKGARLHLQLLRRNREVKEAFPLLSKGMFNKVINNICNKLAKRKEKREKYMIKRAIAYGLPLRERGFLTLFKVLRKASIFSKQGNYKKSRFYFGLVKREWKFLHNEIPKDLKAKINGLLECVSSADPGKNLEKLEIDIRQAITEYFEKQLPSKLTYEFKKAVIKQDTLLEKKALSRRLR